MSLRIPINNVEEEKNPRTDAISYLAAYTRPALKVVGLDLSGKKATPPQHC